MENNNVSIDSLIADLDSKINELNEATKSTSDTKTISIKDKAVSVLKGVKEKIISLSGEEIDPEELSEAVDVVVKRSKSLFDETIEKIREMNGTSFEEIVEPVKEVTKEVMSTVEKAKKDQSNYTKKSVEILKEWLLPEEEEKNEKDNNI